MLLLTACNPTGSAVADPNDQCASFDGSAKDNCYAESFKCSKVTNANMRDGCVVELAKIKQDLAVCDLVVSEKTQAHCQAEIAIVKNDLTICENIVDQYWFDNCNFHLGVENNNPKACTMIVKSEQSQKCFKEVALATNQQELCNFAGENRDHCFYKVAGELHDHILCQEISTTMNRDACRINIAEKSNNVDVCEYIGYKQVKARCFALFEE